MDEVHEGGEKERGLKNKHKSDIDKIVNHEHDHDSDDCDVQKEIDEAEVYIDLVREHDHENIV